MTKTGQLAASIRRLVAIDIVLLGFKLAMAEYVCGVVLSLALGIFVLIRAHTAGQYSVVVGFYLACLGVNYVPMLAHTISFGNRENARF